jgi:hypothetical protein
MSPIPLRDELKLELDGAELTKAIEARLESSKKFVEVLKELRRGIKERSDADNNGTDIVRLLDRWIAQEAKPIPELSAIRELLADRQDGIKTLRLMQAMEEYDLPFDAMVREEEKLITCLNACLRHVRKESNGFAWRF